MQAFMNHVGMKAMRRGLRRSASRAEVLLWQELRNRRLGGYRFRRQHSLGAYVVDFYCASEQLVVEVEGEHHAKNEQRLHDAERHQWLHQFGFRIVRIPAVDVYTDPEEVAQQVLRELKKLRQ